MKHTPETHKARRVIAAATLLGSVVVAGCSPNINSLPEQTVHSAEALSAYDQTMQDTINYINGQLTSPQNYAELDRSEGHGEVIERYRVFNPLESVKGFEVEVSYNDELVLMGVKVRATESSVRPIDTTFSIFRGITEAGEPKWKASTSTPVNNGEMRRVEVSFDQASAQNFQDSVEAFITAELFHEEE